MLILRNIALWFGSVFFSISLFSLLYVRIYAPGSFAFLFRVTAMFALPVACLYLPFVMALRDAEAGRIRTILVSGIIIGPASLFVWDVFLDLGSGRSLWQSDGVDLGLAAALFFALVVGFVATTSYVIALKVTYRLTAAAVAKTTVSSE